MTFLKPYKGTTSSQRWLDGSKTEWFTSILFSILLIFSFFYATPAKAATISAGGDQTCAVSEDGTVWCWGRGILGDGNKESPSGSFYDPDFINGTTPVLVTGIHDAISVSTNGRSSCAVLRSGSIKCWGDNEYSQLGVSADSTFISWPFWGIQMISYSLIPVTVEGITDAIAVDGNCAILASGRIICWGGQKLQRENTATVIFSEIMDIHNPIAIANGCALLRTGDIRCWDNNQSEQQIYSSTIDASTSVDVQSIKNAIALTSYGSQRCALLQGGKVQCWGKPFYSSMGSSFYNNTIQTIDGINDAISISANYNSACAVLKNNTIKCWGNNQEDSLGNMIWENVDITSPVTVVGINDAVSVAVGKWHTCALLKIGQIKCWGSNYEWQRGNTDLPSILISAVPANLVMNENRKGYFNIFSPFSQRIDKVFAWAENRLPQFKPSGFSQSVLGYRYRGYQDRYYLAVNEGGTPHVYYFDNTSMDSLMDVGLLSDFLNLVGN